MNRRFDKNKEIGLIYLIIFILVLDIAWIVAAIVITRENEAPGRIDATAVSRELLAVTSTVTLKPTMTPILTATPIPTATPVPQIPAHIQEYKKINDDTVGYINIEGTVIDYPVMYSGDNEYYLHNDFDKQSSYYGAIFLDYRCDVYDMAKTRNIILYGHRMRDGTMFKGLTQYFQRDFFNKHRIVKFDTLAKEMEWEVFAIFETNIEFYYIETEFAGDKEWLDFITKCQGLSFYETDIELKEDDIILTLSTCSTDKNHRVVVMARLIE